ncbi:hypothetical protein CANARDRAFT_27240 [[Candida] arabinofermentans NRRL YB-2248]|uniref:Altered inheritance of mitochondria protein 19 homolog n=1 Tax=[Candida] arabinofermentans NRRL YB-2248 TaxID=983967 RepID=A0A1E4T526_9ASCO|nr:hypothetical protein CANARDRAFT_27240 [[Candida] arabinofermentans NRRL YB-2248]
MSEIPQSNLKSTFAQLSVSPAPAWLLSSSLLATNVIKPSIQTQLQYSNYSNTPSMVSKLLFKPRQPISPYPNTMTTLLFGSFIGLGGFMCYDNDPINGAGVISAWSSLYCLITARNAIWSWKLYPKLLVAGAGLNSVIYGGKFFGFY